MKQTSLSQSSDFQSHLPILNRVRVVLVRTSHSGNLGAVARAMKNMGLSDLVLVSPQCELNAEAEARASGAQDVLHSLKVRESLESAIEDCHWVVGTSARSRHIPWPKVTPKSAAAMMIQMLNDSAGLANDGVDAYSTKVGQNEDVRRCALVFGQESTGLTNEHLALCHAHLYIPANPEYSSLNLATAVQVISYELRMHALAIAQRANAQKTPALKTPALKTQSPTADEDVEYKEPSELDEGGALQMLQGLEALEKTWGVVWDQPLASQQEIQALFDHLEEVLISLDFLNPDNPRLLMTRFRRLFLRSILDKTEVNMLRGMLSLMQKRLKDKPLKGSGEG